MEALACANMDGSDHIAKIAGAAFTANMPRYVMIAESAALLHFASMGGSVAYANYVVVLVFVRMKMAAKIVGATFIAHTERKRADA